MSHCELLRNNDNKTCHHFAPPAHQIRCCCLQRCHLRGQNSPTLNNPCKEGLMLHITPPRVTAGSDLTWEVLFTFGSCCLSESSGCKVSVKKLTCGPLRKSLRFHRFTFCVSLLFFFRRQSKLTGLQRSPCFTLHENQGTRGSRGRNWPVWVPQTGGVRVEHVGWQLLNNTL